MHLPLFVDGKWPGRVLMVTNTSGLSPSRLFFVTDRTSGLRLLVDTGAEVSVLPVAQLSRSSLPAGPPAQAVNNSSIATFGTTSRTLNLGLRRTTLIYHNLMKLWHYRIGSSCSCLECQEFLPIRLWVPVPCLH